MNKFIISLTCALTLLSAQAAKASIEVSFEESAPKDLFVVTNASECTLQDLVLEIDLSQSDGGLLFDTTATGAGVDVFQPFEVRQGNIELISADGVKDGDAHLSVSITNLAVGKTASFTIDVDDTLANSELGKTRVAGAEIKNGLVTFSHGEQEPVTAAFGADSKAIIFLPSCP